MTTLPTPALAFTLVLAVMLPGVAVAAGSCLVRTPVDPPVDPDPVLQGYGTDTPAGAGGTTCAVTTLASTGEGSLRDCLATDGPVEIGFDVGGTIVLDATLRIDRPFVSILGQSAPSPVTITTDDTVKNAVVNIRSHDVLIQHVRIRGADSYVGGAVACCHDALSISGPPGEVHHVVIDHVSVSWGADEIMDVWGDARDITISNSILSEALHDAGISSGGPAGRGLLIGEVGSRRISVHHNLIAHSYQRHPSTSADDSQVVNNIVYNWVSRGMDIRARFGDVAANVIGNVLIATDETSVKWRDIQVRDEGGHSVSAYLEDNLGHYRTAAGQPEWALAGSGAYDEAHDDASQRADTPFPMPVVDTWPAVELETRLLDDVGATLPSRDAVDARVVAEVRSRTGYLPDCITGCARPAQR